MKIYIPHQFVTLNEYTNETRRNKFKGATIKREQTNIAYWYFVSKKFETPLKLKFTWYLPNKKKDPDNVCFAKKFILDAMTKAKCIPNDNLNHILGFEDVFIISKEKSGVDIEILNN